MGIVVFGMRFDVVSRDNSHITEMGRHISFRGLASENDMKYMTRWELDQNEVH